jgi:hypothetical protein
MSGRNVGIWPEADIIFSVSEQLAAECILFAFSSPPSF